MDIRFLDPQFFDLVYYVGVLFALFTLAYLYKLLVRMRKTHGSKYPIGGAMRFWLFPVLITALLMAALMRPYGSAPVIMSAGGCVNVIGAVDASVSMYARDVKPDRLELPRKILLELERRGGIRRDCDRVAYFRFDADSRAKLPISIDYDRFIEEILRTEVIEEDILNESPWNTDLVNAFSHIPLALARQDTVYTQILPKVLGHTLSGYEGGVLAGRPSAVILFSDGDDELEDDEYRRLDSIFTQYRRLNMHVITVAVGTQQGYSKLLTLDHLLGNASGRLLQTPAVKEVTDTLRIQWQGQETRLQTETLAAIANRTNGAIFVLDDEKKVDEAISFITEQINLLRPSVAVDIPRTEEHPRELWREVVIAAVIVAFFSILLF